MPFLVNHNYGHDLSALDFVEILPISHSVRLFLCVAIHFDLSVCLKITLGFSPPCTTKVFPVKQGRVNKVRNWKSIHSIRQRMCFS